MTVLLSCHGMPTRGMTCDPAPSRPTIAEALAAALIEAEVRESLRPGAPKIHAALIDDPSTWRNGGEGARSYSRCGRWLSTGRTTIEPMNVTCKTCIRSWQSKAVAK